MHIEPATRSSGSLSPSELRQHLRVFDSLYREERVRAAVIEMQDMNHGIVRDACIAAMAVGFSLAAWGFSLWYARVQRYQDIILRAEATRPPAPT